MEHKTLLQAAQKMLERGRKRKWAKVVSLMAAVVVFCTTYALILPAITASTQPICGMEEHTHGDDCFEIREALPLLRCTAEDLAIHEHTDDCRSDEGELICGMADFLVHSHQDGCYDGNGKLVCDLEEIEEHEHRPACWIEEETLICALEEDPGHSHDETCYKQIKGELICTSEEYEGHSHGDSCYKTVTEQVPKTVETTVEIPCAVTDEGHVCDDSCITTEVTTGIEYEEKTVEKLVCEIPEDPGHAHGDTCYAWTPELTCTLEERPPVHIHEDACYETEEVLVCGKDAVEVHEHDPDCYGDVQLEDGTVLVFADAYEAAEAAWTGEGEYVLDPIEWADYLKCGKPEVREHSHEEACFEWPEEGATVEVNLCGKEEHTHDEILCYPTQDVYYCGLPEHRHGDSCPVDENGELICALEEHVHDEMCRTVALMMAPRAAITLDSFINNVTVQHKRPDSNVWEDVTDNQVQMGDDLRFDIQYTIPGKTLSTDNHTVTYQAPVNAVVPESGDVLDSAKNVVGTYNISSDGLITITFNEEYASQNASGNEIVGHIAFVSSVEAMNNGQPGNTNVAFKENVVLNFEIRPDTSADLLVKKAQSEVDMDNGTLSYTIKVTSKNGTGGPVVLTDTMTNVALNGNITVTSKNGAAVAFDKTDIADGFKLELPQMAAGEEYTIVYNAKVNGFNNLNGSKKLGNKVTAESTDKNGGQLMDDAVVEDEISRTLLRKNHKQNDNNTITWTITVNEGKHNIGGWILSDKLNNQNFTGSVTITPNPEGGSNPLVTNLPYKFPNDSKETYTVTYTTPVDANMINISNRAILTAPAGQGGEVGVTDNVTANNPLNKTGTGVVMGDASDPDHKLAHFSWQLSIEGPREVANYTIDKQQVSCWYISDEFWNENRHWMTGAQLKEMKPNLEKALQQIGYTDGYKIYAYRWDGTGSKYRDPVEVTDAMGDAAKYSQFRILFYGSTTADQNISFEYTTTVDVGTGKSDVSVTNWVSVNNQASVQPSQKYAPLVVKKDKVGNTAEDTYHDFNNAHLPALGAGILGWDVSVKIPDMYYSDDFVITENLPEGTKLLDPEHGEWHLSFGVRDTNIGGEPLWFRDNVKTITRKVKPSTVEYTITITKVSDTVYTIKLPAGLANELGGKECFMEVRVQIDDTINWTTASMKFTNTVTVTHGGAELGQGTQSQIIRNPVLTKTSAGPDSANGVSYTVEFNAGGRDYVPGSDTLTLTDTLTIGAANLADVNAALNLGNIKVYRVEQDQTTTDISADCPVTVADDVVVDGKLQKTFSMTVPDSTHIRVEYKYYLTGTTNTNVQLTNEAVIAGASDSVDEEENRIEVTIKESNAGAAVVGVTLKKVDEENYNILLQGARAKANMFWSEPLQPTETAYSLPANWRPMWRISFRRSLRRWAMRLTPYPTPSILQVRVPL